MQRARELVMVGETRAALALLRDSGMTAEMADLARRLGYAKGEGERSSFRSPTNGGAAAPSASPLPPLVQARTLLERGAHEEAARLLDGVGTSSPDYAAALAMRAEVAEAQGDLTTARWAAEAALRVRGLDAELLPTALLSARISLAIGDTGSAAARAEQIRRAGLVTDDIREELDGILDQIGEGPYFRPRVLPRAGDPERPIFPPARPRAEVPPPEEITNVRVEGPFSERAESDGGATANGEGRISRDEFSELLRSLGGEVIRPPSADFTADVAPSSRAPEDLSDDGQVHNAAFMSWPSDNEPIELEMESSPSSSDSEISASQPIGGLLGEVSGQDVNEDETLPEFTSQHDRYEFRRKIGAGGMGVVFEARDAVDDRDVVVKLLQNAKLPSDTAKDLFLREAMVVAYLNHPNIVAVHDFGHMGDHPYIAMEYVRGTDLRRRVRASQDQRLPSDEVIHVFRQVAAALGYAHEQGIVHRDIKLSNVMVTDDGVAKLLDFGIAQAVDNASRTGESRLMGTPLYMAPELIRREEFDHRVDLYALGVAMYRVLTGVYPFQGKDVLKRHLRKEPKDPQLHNADIPMELGSIVLRCLEKSPLARYQKASEIEEALAALG